MIYDIFRQSKISVELHYPPELLKEVNSGHLRSAEFHRNGRDQKPVKMTEIEKVRCKS